MLALNVMKLAADVVSKGATVAALLSVTTTSQS
jgi:hypothetical protein